MKANKFIRFRDTGIIGDSGKSHFTASLRIKFIFRKLRNESKMRNGDTK